MVRFLFYRQGEVAAIWQLANSWDLNVTKSKYGLDWKKKKQQKNRIGIDCLWSEDNKWG